MTGDTLKAEAELRSAAIDRLIAASSSYDKLVFAATLERWRNMSLKSPNYGAQKSRPTEA